MSSIRSLTVNAQRPVAAAERLKSRLTACRRASTVVGAIPAGGRPTWRRNAPAARIHSAAVVGACGLISPRAIEIAPD